ncbi:universal stress protein [Terrimonas sp. NA20]|uniref:Universal stress protein n=1 Tax=Terrimonas ginsenosidimutans TaxID=2908004 RepID=A0ABS9KVE7_9BACT|nr:universal stress protein [Terrimonas ginsenosidimutans]MCG2616283.1 universal stress protein [Terrimonas ginsenosidimutans]
MKKIIVPTDFSDAAFNAATYAVEMALELQLELLLLNVYQIPVGYVIEPPIFPLSMEEIKADCKRKLDGLRLHLERITAGKIKISTIIQLGGY